MKQTVKVFAIGLLAVFGIAVIKAKFGSGNNLKEKEPITKVDSDQLVKDSISKAKLDSIDKINAAFLLEKARQEDRKWMATKAGKVFKKHPEWTREECERIARGEIWIGMHYKMLVYMWGKPDSANPSNYGNGNQWQWCWHGYTPSCFYGGDDGIVTSYN